MDPIANSFFLKGKIYQEIFLDGYALKKEKKDTSRVFHFLIKYQHVYECALMIQAQFNSLLVQQYLTGNNIKSYKMQISTYSDVTAKDLIYISLSRNPQLLCASPHLLLSLNIWSLRAHGWPWKCFLTAAVVVTLGSDFFSSCWRCFHLWEGRFFAFAKVKSLHTHCWAPSTAAELTPALHAG